MHFCLVRSENSDGQLSSISTIGIEFSEINNEFGLFEEFIVSKLDFLIT